MIKAVLLDMDDTLLHTNTELYVQRYINLLTEKAAQQFSELSVEEIRLSIRAAVRGSIENHDPTRTNAEVAADIFSARTGILPQRWVTFLDDFHHSSHESLREIVSPIPDARPLIERLQASGLAVVVATNPIFTHSAIERRLAWAGLAHIEFSFVSSSENMHFTKPTTHYYAEILARVGVEPDEAIMVGDGVANDIVPAQQAGIATYWLDTYAVESGEGVLSAGRGSLADFAEFVASGGLNRLPPPQQTAAQIFPRLLGSVGALFGLRDLIKPTFWEMRPDPNEWSPLEIVHHLWMSEREVQRPRLQRIAVEENPFISPPRTPPAPGALDLTGVDGNLRLRDFWDERCATLHFLHELSPTAWSRPARHSVFGPTTLLEMAHFTARHDHLHITQLCQTIGRCKEI